MLHLFSPASLTAFTHTSSLSQHSQKGFILWILQSSSCSQVNQGCTDVWRKGHLMISMQSLPAHTALCGKGRAHSFCLYCWQVSVCHSFLPSTLRHRLRRVRVAFISHLLDWLLEGKPQSVIYHLSVVRTCTHAVRYTKPPVWVLGAWLGELEVEVVLY